MKSINWWKTKTKLDISAAHSGSEAISAYVFDNKIFVDFDNLGSGEIVTVDTPFDFEVVDAYLRVKNGGNVTSKTLTVKNNTTALSSALSMATDKGIARTTTLDSAQAVFSKGDNDLKLVSSAHNDGDALVVISIVPG